MKGSEKSVSILGSTGSIGTQSLDVCSKLGLRVAAITANMNAALMEEQVRRFSPDLAVLTDEGAAADLKLRIRDTNTKVRSGMDGQCEAASFKNAELVLAAIVGMAGLQPVISAIRAKKALALANKETLVAGGTYITNLAKEYGVKILPVDSEHSAIFQSIQGAASEKEIKKLIITASGGPFFGRKRADLQNVTVEQTLKHPNWSMGGKITVDSATLMNKGLEYIEAVRLFNVKPEQIRIVVHRESVVHSLVEFCDNSVIAQLGVPDMRIPIEYALTYPERGVCIAPELDLVKYGSLSFYEPDVETFTPLKTCMEAVRIGGTMPAAVNSANEAAVSLFLRGRLSFTGIMDIVGEALKVYKPAADYSLSDIYDADMWARAFVADRVK